MVHLLQQNPQIIWYEQTQKKKENSINLSDGWNWIKPCRHMKIDIISVILIWSDKAHMFSTYTIQNILQWISTAKFPLYIKKKKNYI